MVSRLSKLDSNYPGVQKSRVRYSITVIDEAMGWRDKGLTPTQRSRGYGRYAPTRSPVQPTSAFTSSRLAAVAGDKDE